MVFGFGGGSFGNQPPIPPATAVHQGLMSAADKLLVAQLTTASAWVALPYAANWSDLAGGNGAGLYRKDAFGRVWLSGAVKKSVALALPDAITTALPVGYRPVAVHRWLTSLGGVTAEIFISAGGVISILSGGAAAGVALDGISFDPTV